MPKRCYVTHKFGAEALKLVDQANDIITEYIKQGFRLTLRQLFYQFVSRDVLPNTVRSYKRLGSVVNDARLAGLVDWEAIEDRTRRTVIPSAWDSPAAIVATCARQYRRDKWEDQEWRVECWIEKEALAGIVDQVCSELNIPHLSCRGYTSQSEMWGSAQRLISLEGVPQKTLILHLGDHDPSGIDMTRDIAERLAVFGSYVDVKRIALNMDQVQEYGPPPNPAKVTDSRFESYRREYGEESWELDALEPPVLAHLIREHALEVRDEGKWQAAVEREARERRQLRRVSDIWDSIIDNQGFDKDDPEEEEEEEGE